MSLINERYDKRICICLQEREDKYKYMLAQFIRNDLDVDFYRPVIQNYSHHFIKPYAEIHNKRNQNYVRFNPEYPNEFGCFLSHYHVIKSALLNGAESIFVFEDDCAFHKDFTELLPKYLDTIPEGTDGILLYSFMYALEAQNIRVKPRWTKGFMSWSFLAYGLNRRAMEGYIKLQDETPMIADRGSWTMMTQLNYNFYIASPPLVVPSKTLTSNIRGENKNYQKNKSVFLLGISEDDYL